MTLLMKFGIGKIDYNNSKYFHSFIGKCGLVFAKCMIDAKQKVNSNTEVIIFGFKN
jgi:hypothetical protein